MQSAKILVVDDNPAICEVVCAMLNGEGYAADYALNAEHAMKKINAVMPDIVLVDWMMPKTDGTDLVRYLRSMPETAHLGIIMLSAKDQESDKVHGLDCGCDDYISKPFSKSELSARVTALLRRSKPHKELKNIVMGRYAIYPLEHQFKVSGQVVALTATEFRLLYFMMVHSNQALSRRKILNHVWDADKYIEERTVDVHIRRLRKVLSNHQAAHLIATARGIGYRFVYQQDTPTPQDTSTP